MKKTLLILVGLMVFASSCKEDIVDTTQNQLEDITSEAQFDAAIKEGVSMIFYHASWCTKCAAQRPAVEAQTENQDFSSVFFGEVEYEDFPSIVTKSKVNGFPTIVIFKNGEEVKRFSGQGHSESEIRAALTDALN